MIKIAAGVVASLFILLNVCQCEEDQLKRFVKLETKQGVVRGVIEKARDEQEFVSFYGIPYAQPPVGELRWKPPATAATWEKVRDATKSGSPCFQDEMLNPSNTVGSEDCLFLDVYTKKGMSGDDASLKKVMVWIHGGAFIFGAADWYHADYLMEEDIVLVVIQYRLNIFGFLSTEDSNLPGNYGMLDQVEALRWVQKYISDYGGNPDDVTIFGMSAGGASVHYLTMSPMTKGLYKNAISLSGTAFCWWASIAHPREQAVKLAKHFECPDVEDNLKLEECLRKIPGDKLAKAQKKVHFHWRADKTEREPMNYFSPRSDPESSTPFLPHPPIVAMELGLINPSPYMIGFTDKEGIWRGNMVLPNGGENSVAWREFVADFYSIGAMAFGLHGGQTKDAGEIMDRLKEFYNLNDLHEDQLTDDKINNVIDVMSDSMFIYAIDETAKLRASHSKEVQETYYYMLSYASEHTLANLANDGTIRRPIHKPLEQAAHGSDLLLFFKLFPFEPMNEQDLAASRNFTKLLVDFGRTGKPNIEEWKPLDNDDPSYLVIGDEYKVEKGFPLEDRMNFWRTLPPVYWRYTNPVKRVITENKVKDEL